MEDLDPLKNEEIVVEIYRGNLKSNVEFKIYDPIGKLEEGIGIGVD